LLPHDNNGYANAPHYYVYSTSLSYWNLTYGVDTRVSVTIVCVCLPSLTLNIMMERATVQEVQNHL